MDRQPSHSMEDYTCQAATAQENMPAATVQARPYREQCQWVYDMLQLDAKGQEVQGISKAEVLE